MKHRRWFWVFALVLAACSPAWAGGPNGSGGSNGAGGPQMVPMWPCWAIPTAEGQAFAQEVAPLVGELYQSHLQYQQMLNDPNTDPEALGMMIQKMQQIRQQIWKKAQQAGIPCGYGSNGNGTPACLQSVQTP